MKLTIIGVTENPNHTIHAIGEDGSRWFWGMDEDGKWDKDWVACTDDPPVPSLVVDDSRRCKEHGLWDCVSS